MPEDFNNRPKKPFRVTISDEDYMKPDELDSLRRNKQAQSPSVPEFSPASDRHKVEVQIDEEEDLLTFEPENENPEYKGEVYFSAMKPVRNEPPKPAPKEQGTLRRRSLPRCCLHPHRRPFRLCAQLP